VAGAHAEAFGLSETDVIERDQMVPLYRVVLLDDNDHTYDYVIEMLQRISSSLWIRPTSTPKR